VLPPATTAAEHYPDHAGDVAHPGREVPQLVVTGHHVPIITEAALQRATPATRTDGRVELTPGRAADVCALRTPRLDSERLLADPAKGTLTPP